MYGVNLSIRATGDLAQRIVLPEDFKKWVLLYCFITANYQKMKGDHFQAIKSFQKMKFLKGHSAEKIQVKNTKIVKGKVLSMFLRSSTLV